jgi:hypothetical protein
VCNLIHPNGFCLGDTGSETYIIKRDDDDDDVSEVYLFFKKQKGGPGAELHMSHHIYLEEGPGTYQKRLFRGPSTNDMKK